jgi:copper transport protein
MTPVRCVSTVAGVLLGLAVVFLGPAVPASAHAALVSTDPPAGSVLPAGPAEVVFTFSESVRLVPGRTHAVGPDGRKADTGTPTVRGDELHVPLRETGARGTYLVSYRVISADSHPVGGSLTFSVGTVTATPAGADNAARTDPLVATLLGAAHYLGYAGLVLVVGPAVVLYALWPRRLSRRGPVRLLFGGMILVILGTGLELFLQAPYSAGVGLFGASADDLRETFSSVYGAAHLVRLAAVAAVAVLLRPFLTAPGAGGATDAPRAGTADRALLAVLAVVGLATWPMAGHGGASTLPEVTAVADVAHLGAMSVWLGGLVVLVGYLLRTANATELDAILPVWSRWATTAVVVLVVAGTVQALVEIGSVGALLHTTYGRLVVVKVTLLALVLVAAFFARRVARAAAARAQSGEAVADQRTGRTALRRSVLVELTVTAVVLAMSATLVQTTPARSAQAVSNQQNIPLFSTTLNSSLYSLQIDVDPARVGDNSVHLYAYTPEGGPIKVVEWHATAALPGKGVEPLTVPLLPLTDDHATGEVQLPTAGVWEFKLTLRTTDIDEASVTANVPVRN